MHYRNLNFEEAQSNLCRHCGYPWHASAKFDSMQVRRPGNTHINISSQNKLKREMIIMFKLYIEAPTPTLITGIAGEKGTQVARTCANNSIIHIKYTRGRPLQQYLQTVRWELASNLNNYWMRQRILEGNQPTFQYLAASLFSLVVANSTEATIENVEKRRVYPTHAAKAPHAIMELGLFPFALQVEVLIPSEVSDYEYLSLTSSDSVVAAPEYRADGFQKEGYKRGCFEGCTHGFAVRGDMNDAKVKPGKEGAFKSTTPQVHNNSNRWYQQASRQTGDQSLAHEVADNFEMTEREAMIEAPDSMEKYNHIFRERGSLGRRKILITKAQERPEERDKDFRAHFPSLIRRPPF
ncbi:hypothetical protein BYT27DRAFT_7320549 [Phlegmacium glaucopus]|nr:hypothetical protein BYT27DRAFT_7320549 [Phlegmacium glaucopus]